MAFEVPHKHDISLDSQEMRNQMIENFEAIEQEDKDDDQALSDEVADRKKGDGIPFFLKKEPLITTSSSWHCCWSCSW